MKTPVLLAALALAPAPDEHPIIHPVPDSILLAAGHNDDREMTVTYRKNNRRERKTVTGGYWSLEYKVRDDMARDAIIEHFVHESERLQGVIRREAGNRLTFTAMRDDGGETWCQVWATDGSYTLEIVDEAPPDHAPFDESAQPSATIVFARDRAALDDGAERVLDAIADWLEIHPHAAAEVRGHRGPLEDPALPEARAKVVAEAILDRGIDEERIIVAADTSNQGFEVTVVAIEP